MKKISLLTALLLSLMLLISACSGSPKETNNTTGSPSTQAAQESTEPKVTEPNKSTAAATETEKDQADASLPSDQETGPSIKAAEGVPTVTGTTTFVVDIVNRLAKDLVKTELIIPAGDDPHLYEPKPGDLQKLTESDLVIYHGLHFEGRMIDVLEKIGHQLARNFDAAKVGVMDDDGDLIVDPHFWFDIDLYKQGVENVADYLTQLLPDKADVIKTNKEAYLKELDEMLAASKAKMDTIPKESKILITPHDAFNYFSRTFDIPVMAPQGVSTDSEVANKDIQDTVDFIVKNKVKAVFAETTTDPARMEKLKDAAKAQGFEVKVVSGEGNELFSDSLAPAGQTGDNFIDMFTHNVDLIVKNLK